MFKYIQEYVPWAPVLGSASQLDASLGQSWYSCAWILSSIDQRVIPHCSPVRELQNLDIHLKKFFQSDNMEQRSKFTLWETLEELNWTFYSQTFFNFYKNSHEFAVLFLLAINRMHYIFTLAIGYFDRLHRNVTFSLFSEKWCFKLLWIFHVRALFCNKTLYISLFKLTDRILNNVLEVGLS